jgi:hypothetical protein
VRILSARPVRKRVEALLDWVAGRDTEATQDFLTFVEEQPELLSIS